MIQDITGNKYGELTVLRYTGEKNKAGNVKWECLCSCGNKTIVSAGDLKSGRVKSYGCLLYNVHKRQNRYDLSGEYGIGYLRGTNDVFYFDKDTLLLTELLIQSQKHHFSNLITNNVENSDVTKPDLTGYEITDYRK